MLWAAEDGLPGMLTPSLALTCRMVQYLPATSRDLGTLYFQSNGATAGMLLLPGAEREHAVALGVQNVKFHHIFFCPGNQAKFARPLFMYPLQDGPAEGLNEHCHDNLTRVLPHHKPLTPSTCQTGNREHLHI